MSYDVQTELAGLPALRVTTQGGAHSYGSDQYYLIHGEQLFMIGILHAGGREDWELYEKFLESFSFP